MEVEEDGAVEEEVTEEEAEEAVVVAVGLVLLNLFMVFSHKVIAFGGRGAPRGGRGGPGGRGGGGRGGGRGRGGKPAGRGAKGGSNVIIEPHRHAGVFIAKGKEQLLVTKNLVPGESVYGEKRISVDGGVDGTKIEYRVWNPFRSKLAAGILGGVSDIYIAPGKKVLYLGAASGTSVSHVADVVGPVRKFLHNLSCSKTYYML